MKIKTNIQLKLQVLHDVHTNFHENHRIRSKAISICKEWNLPAFHYRHININHPENET
jgi:hypothetical protein